MSATRVRPKEERPAAERAPTPVPAGSSTAWAWFLGIAFAGGLVYFALPEGSEAQGVVFAGGALAVPVAIAIGIARNRPPIRTPWFLLLAAWILYQLANLPWTLFPRVDGRPLPYPSPVDWLYWASYAVIALALISLIRARGRDRGGVIDALVVTAGLGILAYAFLIHPSIHLHGVPTAARMASAAYPLLDLLLVASVAALAFTRGPRPSSFWLLCSAIVIQLLCDVGYSLGLLDGTFGPRSPSHLGWMVSYGAYGAAALHPSMRSLTESWSADPGIGPLRRGLLALAAVLPIGFLIAVEAEEGQANGVVGAAVAALVFLLVQVRLAGLSESLEDTRQAGERERTRADELDQVRERLRRAEEQYRSLVEHVPAVVYECEPGPEGRWTYLSPQIERMLGFTVEEWTSDEALWARQLHPEDREWMRADEDEAWRRAEEDRHESGTVSAEYRVRHRDGRTVWIRDDAFVVRDEDGRPVRWRGLLHDITDIRRAREELEHSHSLLEATLEAAGDAIVVIGADRRVTRFNRRYLDMWGLTDDLVGRDIGHLRALLTDRMLDPEGYLERSRWLDEHPEAEATDVLELRDGRIFERTSKPQRLGDRVVGRVWSFRDITELNRAQTDLKRSLAALRETDAQRRRLLTRLVEVQEEERSRIAADFHDDTIQVMTAVGMRLEALRTRLEKEEDRARVRSLESNVTGAVARLRNLLFELRPRALDREGLVAALRVYLGHGGTHDGVTYHVDSALLEEPPLETRVVLYRAAQEALANARKHSGASNVWIEIRQPNDGYLVRIVDDGKGFSPSAEGKPGHLGIVAMRDRVEMTGGWLRLESAEGKGTTVEFWVPGPHALQAGAGAG
jgi:PAS domain S-box-containing protein